MKLRLFHWKRVRHTLYGERIQEFVCYKGFTCYSLAQDPFKNVPLIWTIHEQTLAARLRQYVLRGQSELIDTWRKVFSRATVIIFPNYILLMAYSACNHGNYFIVPGTPEEAWKADKQIVSMKDNLGLDKWSMYLMILLCQLWGGGYHIKTCLEHASFIQALYPLFVDFGHFSTRLEITVLIGDSD